MNLCIVRDIFDFVMYYIYEQSGPSLLIESFMTLQSGHKGVARETICNHGEQKDIFVDA